MAKTVQSRRVQQQPLVTTVTSHGTAADVRFSSTELRHEPGQVTVTFDNRDLFWHTFTIDELDVDR